MGGSKTQTFFKGVSYQSMTLLSLAVLEIIIFPIWSRVLSKTDFGYFAALSGIVAIIFSLSEAGLGSAIIQKKVSTNEHISTAYSLSIIFGSFFSLFLFVFAEPLATLVVDDNLVNPLRVMSVLIFFNSISSIGRSIMTRDLKFGKLGIIQVITFLVSSLIGIFMAIKGFGIWSVVTTSVCNSILATFLYFYNSSRLPKFGIYKTEIKGIVNFGGWLTMGVILNNITHQVDKILLSKWLSVTLLGAYNRPAGFITNVTSKINGVFDTVLFPMLSEMQDDIVKTQQVFKRAISLLNSFSIILAAIFFFHAELIIFVFFGKEWVELIPVMRILAFSVVFGIDNRLADCFYRSLALVKASFFIRLFQTVITILGIYLGCFYGIIGVATSVTLTTILTIFLKIIVLSIKLNMNLLSILFALIVSWKPLIYLLIICIPYMMVSHDLTTNIVFAIMSGIVIVVEFLIFPKMVGNEYCKTIGPVIGNIKKKFIRI